MIVVDFVLLLLAIPVSMAAGYLAVLSVVSVLPRRAAKKDAPIAPTLRFDVIVPAHDEEVGIAATVKSLLAADYPPHLRRVLVVADNCTDSTAARAREAGATVIVRDDPRLRGKGHAIARALEQVEADDVADAVLVVDADSLVSPNILTACAQRLADGAEAVQVEYAVSNPEASWRTRLMVIALAMFHRLRSVARQRLGLSAGLRGNGMAFTRALLRRIPYGAFSLVEDVEYGITLGEHGVRVHFADDARVYGEMVAGSAASSSQRRRWESGREALARAKIGPLLRRAWRGRDPVALDLALDLLVPPLSSIAVAALGGAVICAAAVAFGHTSIVSFAALATWLSSIASLVLYVLRGWTMSSTGARGLGALLWAPAFVAWKLGMRVRDRLRRAPVGSEWVRTAREGRTP